MTLGVAPFLLRRSFTGMTNSIRPHLGHGADFDIDEPGIEPALTNHVSRDVGDNTGTFLRRKTSIPAGDSAFAAGRSSSSNPARDLAKKK